MSKVLAQVERWKVTSESLVLLPKVRTGPVTLLISTKYGTVSTGYGRDGGITSRDLRYLLYNYFPAVGLSSSVIGEGETLMAIEAYIVTPRDFLSYSIKRLFYSSSQGVISRASGALNLLCHG